MYFTVEAKVCAPPPKSIIGKKINRFSSIDIQVVKKEFLAHPQKLFINIKNTPPNFVTKVILSN